MDRSIKNKRVLFPKGKQKKFIDKILSKITIKDVAKMCNLSERTIRDWRREKFLMDSRALFRLCKKTGIPVPSKIKLKNRYWYVYSGSSAGGLAVFKKYGKIGGDPKYRKEKWYQWWEKKGRHRHSFIGKYKSIFKPDLSSDLAEFVGIVMGDGGISKYQITITLNSKDDAEYISFVKKFGEELFRTPWSAQKQKGQLATKLVVSRKKLVDFFVKELGLKTGNKIKQGLDIPRWIQGDINFQISCIRGLVDTDGCIFNEVHKINGKTYVYKRLNFTSGSLRLRKSVFLILEKLNLDPKMRNNRSVQIENKNKIREYFKIIGTSNPKHKRRFTEECGEWQASSLENCSL